MLYINIFLCNATCFDGGNNEYLVEATDIFQLHIYPYYNKCGIPMIQTH